MEALDRIKEVFKFVFSEESPLIFSQIDFWIFFIAVIGVYSVLDFSKRTKGAIAAMFVGLGLLCFAYYDTAIALLLILVNYGLWKDTLSSPKVKYGLMVAVNVLGLSYYIYKISFLTLYLGLSYYDVWLLFLVLVFVLARFHKKFWVRSVFLTGVSLFFYFKSSGLFVLLLSLSLVTNYFMGRWIYNSASHKRKLWIITWSAVFNLLILAFFKYAYFFTDSFNAMFSTDFEIFNFFARWANGFWGEGTFSERIFLPVGVSFFTFQSISYVVDIYRKDIKPVRSFFDYTFFVTFFPQLVAGPIVRAKDFIPQIRAPYKLDNKDFSSAVVQIVKGLLKKVVLADYIAIHFIDKVADAPEAFPGFVSILAMWGYSLQIYGDFSGYTDMAIGLSRLMGFKLLENFNSPYKAINVADFWRRWHKSLGSWLRDYLYIPLGGNRSGGIGTYVASTLIFIFLLFITQWHELIYVYFILLVIYLVGIKWIPGFKKYIHRDLNLIITMVIGGLWHGASENFVIWGAMNGCALIFYNYWKKISPYENKTNRLVHFLKIFITFNFITFTRIWFRLEEDGLPATMLNQIWNNFNYSWVVFIEVLTTYASVFVVMIVGFFIHWMPQRWKDRYESVFERMTLFKKCVSVFIIIVLMYQAISDVSKPFVYFQF
ncbi:MAG: alginate O-acetyltransferase complex protein AlgI [Lentimonas sp.]|jgi:alginate O-acetyltransferase complex protein AlgI